MRINVYIPPEEYKILKADAEAIERSVSWLLVNSWREARDWVPRSHFKRPTEGQDYSTQTKRFFNPQPKGKSGS